MPYEFQSIYLDNPIVPGRVLDIMLPEKMTQDVSIFFVHGGGWAAGSRDRYHTIMRGFNAQGFVCGSTDYRLGPGRMPDMVMDVRHGYSLFVRRLKELERLARVLVCGSSAGAHLAALLALARPGECGEGLTCGDCTSLEPWVAPRGLCVQAVPVTLEPWEDMFPPAGDCIAAAIGKPYADAPETYRRLSPAAYFRKGMCPVFFHNAECEHMFPLSQVKDAVVKIRALGMRAEEKVYTMAEHGFFYDLTRRQQKEMFRDMLDFIASL